MKKLQIITLITISLMLAASGANAEYRDRHLIKLDSEQVGSEKGLFGDFLSETPSSGRFKKMEVQDIDPKPGRVAVATYYGSARQKLYTFYDDGTFSMKDSPGGIGDAGTSGGQIFHIDGGTITRYQDNVTTQTHNVVYLKTSGGYLEPYWWSDYNRWAYSRTWWYNQLWQMSTLTAAEQNYLINSYYEGTSQYYIDVTGQTMRMVPYILTYDASPTPEGITPFQNTTTLLSQGIMTAQEVTTETRNGDTYVTTTNIITVVRNLFTLNYQVIAYLNNYNYYTPLILDLNQDKVVDVANGEWRPHPKSFSEKHALFFDITGDGVEDYVEWVNNGHTDGLLAMPENGKVESALQLFGNAGGFKDGFEKLSIVCDKDKNGWVEGAELQPLKIWIDSNHNGKCEPAELHELSQYGITRLNTFHKDYVGKYATSQGEFKMWDWWPSAMELRKTRHP